MTEFRHERACFELETAVERLSTEQVQLAHDPIAFDRVKDALSDLRMIVKDVELRMLDMEVA